MCELFKPSANVRDRKIGECLGGLVGLVQGPMQRDDGGPATMGEAPLASSLSPGFPRAC